METTGIIGVYRDYVRIIGYILGLYISIMEKNMETSVMRLYWGYIGIMEKKMETSIMGLYRGHIGIMAKKMEVPNTPISLESSCSFCRDCCLFNKTGSGRALVSAVVCTVGKFGITQWRR